MHKIKKALHKEIGKNKDSHLSKYEPARERLIRKNPDLKGHLGISKKGVYMHNKETGFNERVHHRTGKFTGKGAY